MTTARLIKAITLLAVFAMAARVSVDTDTWWHLRAGEWMIENQSIIQVDQFSYTRVGEAWEYPGWLVEVPMALMFRGAGAGGLNLWTAAMVTLAFAFIWSSLSGGPFLRAFVMILAAAASGVYWAARPYLVTFVLAAIFLWVLEDFRWKRKDRLWLLPVLMVVWANSHGGFAVGIILIGIYGIDFTWRGSIGFLQRNRAGPANSSPNQDPEVFPALRKLFLIGVLTVLAIAVNPSGPGMLAYPFKTVSIGALQKYIAEWQSPNFHELRVQPFLWLIILAIGAIGATRKRLAVSDFLLLSVFLYLSVTAARNIALFAVAAPIVLTRYAADSIPVLQRRLGIGLRPIEQTHPSRGIKTINLAIFLLLLIVVLIKAATVIPTSVNENHFEETYPTAAVNYLKENRSTGRLFNSYNWGGWLLWTLPEYPVFIDGRTDLFNDEIISTWLEVLRGEAGWLDTLNVWEVEFVLLEPEQPVISLLKTEGWLVRHEDESSILLERP